MAIKKYTVTILLERLERPLRWCKQNFGPEEVNWVANLNDKEGGKVDFSFCRKQDAVLFALKWL
jgi:hypothetical protein